MGWQESFGSPRNQAAELGERAAMDGLTLSAFIMKPEVALCQDLPWEPLLGVLLYALPLGLLRLTATQPAPPHVRAIDGLTMLTMGCVLPVVAHYLSPWPVVTLAGSGILALFAFRHYLVGRATRRQQPGPSKPLLLLFRGHFLPSALQAAHLSEARVRRRLARHGIRNVAHLYAVVYEPGRALSWSWLSPVSSGPAALAEALRVNPN